MSNDSDDTFIADKPLFAPGEAATPGDSMMLIKQGGPQVQQCVALTGQDRFEHMLLYCLTLLHKATRGDICAFYLDDFPDCDEVTLDVIQRLISRSGYVTSAHREGPNKQYKGFWAWRPVDPNAPAAPKVAAAAQAASPQPLQPPTLPPTPAPQKLADTVRAPRPSSATPPTLPPDPSILPPTLPPSQVPPPLPPK